MSISFPGQVTLYCEAEVAGEKVAAQMTVDARVAADPEARKAIEDMLRHKLMDSILKKWKPKIKEWR